MGLAEEEEEEEEEEDFRPFMVGVPRQQSSPTVLAGKDEPVSVSTNLRCVPGSMNPTEPGFACTRVCPGPQCDSVTQLCSVKPYACTTTTTTIHSCLLQRICDSKLNILDP